MNAPKFDRLWTVEDVAAYLSIPVQTLYQWRSKHYGPPARRVGKYLRFRPEDVKAWFERLGEGVA
jgi:excisionase family DNA binding protein